MVVVGQAIFGQGFGISMMGKEVLFGVFWGGNCCKDFDLGKVLEEDGCNCNIGFFMEERVGVCVCVCVKI